jgi:two-component system, NarL family, response regulator DevR
VTPGMPAIRVFLADEHEVVRRGVAAVLEADPRISVVGEAASGDEARRRALAVQPDVAVVGDAPLCEHLRAALPRLRCLVLDQEDSTQSLRAAVRAGAAGHLAKHVHGADLVHAVQRVAAGETLFVEATAAAATHRPYRHNQDRFAPLTDRERQVLQLLGEGLSNRQVGARLALTEKTVKNYVSVLLAKLYLTNRTQAAILATLVYGRDGAT